jgi:DNA-binding NarL/FixJ family response regulator
MRVARPYITDLEMQVLTLMAHGVAVKAIGVRVGLTNKGVSSARRRVLLRNGLKNYLQLGALMNECQMLPVDVRNEMEDRREVRMDALRSAP